MAKVKNQLFTFYFLFFIFLPFTFFGCQREEIVNTGVVSASGVFVLYEGGFNPGSGDYTFINLSNNSVYSNVYQNSNGGAYLNLIPDGMFLYLNQDLYITAQGSYSGPGTIYKINSNDNRLIRSTDFGSNPYNLTIANNNIFVTNLTGGTVTKLDLNLNILENSIAVGPNPADLIYALSRIYVSKTSYTSENSLAIIDIYSNQVSKVFFNVPPVSAANNTGGLYVSSYTEKKLYILDSLVATQINDSIDFNNNAVFVNEAVGTIIAGDSRTLYIVGVDTVQFTDIGKAVYKYDFVYSTLTKIIEDPDISNIYGISYEPINKWIYIADDNGGLSNGEVRVYKNTGEFIKNYPNIGGRYPRRIVFKYIQ